MQERLKNSAEGFKLEEYIKLISEITDSGGEFRIYPHGTSMLPLIREGKDSVVLIKAPVQLKRKDIVFYKRTDGQSVLHRIIKKKNDESYVMCGDNQTKLEYGIRRGDIIFVVSDIYRGDKKLSQKALSRRIYEFLWCIMPLRRVLLLFKRVFRKIFS